MPIGSRPLVGSSRMTRSRIAEQRGGDAEALLHPERVRAVAVAAAAGEPDEIDQLVDVAPDVVRRGRRASAGCRHRTRRGGRPGLRSAHRPGEVVGAPADRRAEHVADPPVGRTRPRSIAMIVVLPAPLGPIRPATVPDGTANDTWSTAVAAAVPLGQPVDHDGVVGVDRWVDQRGERRSSCHGTSVNDGRGRVRRPGARTRLRQVLRRPFWAEGVPVSRVSPAGGSTPARRGRRTRPAGRDRGR